MGWLPVRLEIDGKVLEFTASDVEEDPLEQLCNSLLDVAAGRESKTEWFLEPDHYEFIFMPSSEEVTLDVDFVESRTMNLEPLPEQRSRVMSWSGSPETVVVSFWRALKKFQHTPIAEKAWPPFPATIFSKLEQRVQGYKSEA